MQRGRATKAKLSPLEEGQRRSASCRKTTSMLRIVRPLSIVHCQLLNFDITERKQSEAALQQSETQLRLITDALPALIAYIDRRQCYQFVNRTYEGWQKQPLTKIIGSHMR